MEIEPFLISTAVLGVQAQRLVRKICSDCKAEDNPNFEIPEDVVSSFGLDQDVSSMKFYRGKGCNMCRGTGYRGRCSIMEVLPVTEHIRELILKSASSEEIKKAAMAEGMRTLTQDGWIKVFKSITTFEEVMRVTNI